jgi:hypothetical protein
MRTAKSCGPDAPTLAQVARKYSRGDGGKMPGTSPGMTGFAGKPYFAGYILSQTAQNDGSSVAPVEVYDSRISSNRRPSLFCSFFTALEAITSPWLA